METGTLASAILTQRSSQRAKLEELEHTERVRRAEQEDAEEKRRTERLRDCYVRLNANDRNYRDALLAYAYALKSASPGEAEAAEVATARREQRDARAEAQMIVSDQVLTAEGKVHQELTRAPSRPNYLDDVPDARDHAQRAGGHRHPRSRVRAPPGGAVVTRAPFRT